MIDYTTISTAASITVTANNVYYYYGFPECR